MDQKIRDLVVVIRFLQLARRAGDHGLAAVIQGLVRRVIDTELYRVGGGENGPVRRVHVGDIPFFLCADKSAPGCTQIGCGIGRTFAFLGEIRERRGGADDLIHIVDRGLTLGHGEKSLFLLSAGTAQIRPSGKNGGEHDHSGGDEYGNKTVLKEFQGKRLLLQYFRGPDTKKIPYLS